MPMKTLPIFHKKNQIKAFTMTEVIIATIIFSLAMAGVFASIANLREPAVESSQEVTAAFIGKRVLDDLRSEVNAATWDTGGLSLGTHTITPAINISGQNYNVSYTVAADVTGGTNARQVTMDITW